MKFFLTLFVLFLSPILHAEILECQIYSRLGKFIDKSEWEEFGKKEYIMTINSDFIDFHDTKLDFHQDFLLVSENDKFLNGFFSQNLEDESDWIGMLKYNKLTKRIVAMYSNPFGETIEIGFCKKL